MSAPLFMTRSEAQAYAAVERATQRAVTTNRLVVLVERVLDATEQFPGFANGIGGAEIHQRVAVEHSRVRRVVIAAARMLNGHGSGQSQRPLVADRCVRGLVRTAH